MGKLHSVLYIKSFDFSLFHTQKIDFSKFHTIMAFMNPLKVTSVSSYLFPVLMLFKSRRLLSHVPMLNPVASSFGGDGPVMALIVFIIFVIFSNLYELL